MRILTFTFMLLCSHSSVSGLVTLDVQLGEDITLLCSNISNQSSQTDWFRVVNGTDFTCIASLFDRGGKVSYCDGFEDGRFEMSANTTSLVLKIKRLDFNDCGLYFCGIYKGQNTIIVNVTELRIQDNSNRLEQESTATGPGHVTGPVSVVLGALTLILTLTVIALAVKVRKLQTAAPDDSQPGRSRVVNSDLTYAAVNVQAKAQRNHRAAPQGPLDTHVVYATTR